MLGLDEQAVYLHDLPGIKIFAQLIGGRYPHRAVGGLVLATARNALGANTQRGSLHHARTATCRRSRQFAAQRDNRTTLGNVMPQIIR